MNFRPASLAAFCALLSLARGRPSNFTGSEGSSFDLALTGRLAGLAAGETRYVTWAALRALPTSAADPRRGISPKGPAGTDRRLPRRPGEGAAARTRGRHGPRDLRRRLRRGLHRRLHLNLPPVPRPGDQWQQGPAGLAAEGPGLQPGALRRDGFAGAGPRLRPVPGRRAQEAVGRHDARVRVLRRPLRRPLRRALGRSLPEAAREGREIWVNSCASCHAGPAGTFGGTKSGRPFPVIAAYAGADRSYFTRYIRDPKSLVPCAQGWSPTPGTPTPSFRDLAAFITAGPG